MRRVAIANQKGGVGKTTTTVSLAGILAEQGYRVLVLDMDPQANTSMWLLRRDDGHGLREVLVDGKPLVDLVEPSAVPGLQVIPSSLTLTRAARELQADVGGELALREAIERLPADQWEVLLIDCPPELGLLSASALVAADGVLIPVETHAMPLQGLRDMRRTIEAIQRRLNPGLRELGVVPCRVDARSKLAGDVLKVLHRQYGELVMPLVRANVRLAEAPSRHLPISVYAPTSSGAADYRMVGAALLERLEAAT
jgi:chromosome partitioning protein